MESYIDREIDDSKGGFWFIDTIVDTDIPLPYNVMEDVKLERASPEQIATIKSHLNSSGVDLNILADNREYEHVPESSPESGEDVLIYKSKSFPKEKWRYFILTFKGNSNKSWELIRLGCIANPPFTCTSCFHTSKEFGRGNVNYVTFYGLDAQAHLALEKVPILKIATISDLIDAMTKLGNLKKQFPDLQRAAHMLRDLERVPTDSELYYLGLFAILEMLLTHNPQDRENADSLNHQLRTKIPLVSSRMPHKLDYSMFKGNKKSGEIWALLYGYRSSVAHGSVADFKGKLQALGNAFIAREFVDHACRLLVRHALDEPELYRDLKLV